MFQDPPLVHTTGTPAIGRQGTGRPDVDQKPIHPLLWEASKTRLCPVNISRTQTGITNVRVSAELFLFNIIFIILT